MIHLHSEREIFCTLGPASLNERVISRLTELNVTLFRINLSHTKLQDLPDIIALIRRSSDVPICLDTEGAQIRTGDMLCKQITVHENTIIHAHRNRVPGDAYNFNFYPNDVVNVLQIGDFISIDFNSVLVEVIDRDENKVSMRVLHGGLIGQNKAVTVERDIPMDPLTEKDRAALVYGRGADIKHVALSFANRTSDIDVIRALCVPNVFLISKIECRNAMINFDEIARCSDGLLIDRGDLSRQTSLERIPRLQKEIIRRARELGRKVYVATNLLESMITSPKPTRAEVNDVINTLLDGADGLVLAAETAIGQDPISCVSMIVKLIREFQQVEGDGMKNPTSYGEYFSVDVGSLLVEPHGGELVSRRMVLDDRHGLDSLRKVPIRDTDLLDCQHIAAGGYSPLQGFMNRETLESVLTHYCLPGGLPWTMPILLQCRAVNTKGLEQGEHVALTDARGTPYALLEVESVYSFDLLKLVKRWFGTESRDHPGVARIMNAGDRFIAGKVTMLQEPSSAYRAYELTPLQTRFIFAHKGWSKIIGFYSRSVIHRVHEHIQLEALAQTHADGLYLNTAITPKKIGDFLPGPIIKSYQLMIDFGIYPLGKVLLGCCSTYPRFCGPREAVFTAIRYKNMGCSHFIVDRNHTGVETFYPDSGYKKLFEKLGELGVAPIFFDRIGFNPNTRSYEAKVDYDLLSVSSSQTRDLLLNDKPIPDWVMRDIVVDMLKTSIRSGQPVSYGEK